MSEWTIADTSLQQSLNVLLLHCVLQVLSDTSSDDCVGHSTLKICSSHVLSNAVIA